MEIAGLVLTRLLYLSVTVSTHVSTNFAIDLSCTVPDKERLNAVGGPEKTNILRYSVIFRSSLLRPLKRVVISIGTIPEIVFVLMFRLMSFWFA